MTLLRNTLAAVLLIGPLSGCVGDAVDASGPTAAARLAIGFSSSAARGGIADALARADRVRLQVVRDDDLPVMDTTVALDGGVAVIAVPAEASGRVSIDVTVLMGSATLFTGGGSADIAAGMTNTAEVTIIPVVAGVRVAPETATLDIIGATLPLGAAAVFASGDTVPDRVIAWTSIDPLVATVAQDGVVTAHAEGIARIRAAHADHASEAVVTVAARVARVAIAPSTFTLNVGDRRELRATAFDAGGSRLDRAIVWSSGNPAVATVTRDGSVLAVAPGDAVIQASPVGGGPSGDARITVVRDPVASVEVHPAALELQPGASDILHAVTRNGAGELLTGRNVLWASSAEEIATVDATGRVTAVSGGTATISATSEGHAGAARVTVFSPVIRTEPDEITFSAIVGRDPAPAEVRIMNGGTGSLGTLSASAVYAGGSGWLDIDVQGTRIGITARAANLDIGTYDAVVIVRSAVPGVAPDRVPVRLTVRGGDPPAAPAIRRVTAFGFDDDVAMGIRIDWTDNSSDETSFVVERRAEPDGDWSRVATVSSDTTSYTDGGSKPLDTMFLYRVGACNRWGCSRSPAARVATPPNRPRDVIVRRRYIGEGVYEYAVSWTDASNVETHYIVQPVQRTLPANSTSLSYRSRLPYAVVTVAACNPAGCRGSQGSVATYDAVISGAARSAESPIQVDATIAFWLNDRLVSSGARRTAFRLPPVSDGDVLRIAAAMDSSGCHYLSPLYLHSPGLGSPRQLSEGHPDGCVEDKRVDPTFFDRSWTLRFD